MNVQNKLGLIPADPLNFGVLLYSPAGVLTILDLSLYLVVCSDCTLCLSVAQRRRVVNHVNILVALATNGHLVATTGLSVPAPILGLDNFNFSAKGAGELGEVGALRFPLAGGADEGGVHVAAVLGPEPVGFAW